MRKKNTPMKQKYKIPLLVATLLIIGCVIVCGSLYISGSPKKNIDSVANEDIAKNTQGADNNKITLQFHYSREDDAYDQWSLWIWEDTEEGRDYSFKEIKENEACAYVDVDNKTLEAGYIIHTEDWEKDIVVDRSIDLSETAGGIIDIYLTQGVEEAEVKTEKAIIISPKVVEAVYDGDHEITVKMSDMTINFQEPQVHSTMGDIAAIDAILTNEDYYILSMDEPLTATQSYSLVYQGASYIIDMPNIYSTEAR